MATIKLPPRQVIFYGDEDTPNAWLPFSTLGCSSKPVYDSDGRTILYHAVTYTVAGMLTEQTDGHFAAELETIRKRLGKPRQRLIIALASYGSDATMLPDPQYLVDTGTFPGHKGTTSEAYDVNWGPLPGDFVVEEIPGGMAARFRWDVTIHRLPCDDPFDGAPIPRWQGLTFTSVCQIDADGYTTRVINGKITVGQDEVPANQWRTAVAGLFPIPGDNWRRTSQAFTQSEDARLLQFDVQDREIQAALPNPATSGDATYTVSTGMGRDSYTYGFWRFALSGTFRCPRGGTKTQLKDAVINLAKSKIPNFDDSLLKTLVSGASSPGFTKLENISFSEGVYENSLSFNISGITAWTGNEATEYPGLGKHPPATQQAVVGEYGNTEETTYVPYSFPQTPCEKHTVKTDKLVAQAGGGQVPVPGASRTTSGSPTFFGSGPSNESDTTPASTYTQAASTFFSEEQSKAPYIVFNEIVTWDYDSGLVAIPPLADEGDLFVQRARPPVLDVCQTGYAVRYGSPDGAGKPVAPEPILPKNQRAMLRYSITPELPQLIAPQTMRYKVSWVYMMRYTKAAPTPALASWPSDPRLAKADMDDPLAGLPPDVGSIA